MAMTFWQELDELRARVRALEAKYETMRLATLEWGKDVENLQRWSDQHLLRIERLEAGATCPHIVSSDEGTSYCDLALQTATSQPDPIDEEENDLRFRAALAAIENATPEQIRSAAGLPERSSLVERVALAISGVEDSSCRDDEAVNWAPEARAAIREVAAWLIDRRRDDDWLAPFEELAELLQEEADQ
jgi:hypothetical protein